MSESVSVEILEAAAAGDPIALCRAMVATPSVNPVLAEGGSGERAMADLTAGWLRSWGLATEVAQVAPGRFNVIGRMDGMGPTLLLNGHLDTVGVESMTIPPFEAGSVDGKILGRGSCDMKGGNAAILAATFRMSKIELRPNLIVALTADEEHSSLGMAHLVTSGVWADFAVVCEPTNLSVMPAHKGFVWIEAEFRGRAAHGSRPDLGVDAIRHAGLFLAALDEYAEALEARPAHPLLQHGSFHAGTIQGGSAESVYPEACSMLLERRTMPGEKPDDVLAEFRDVLDRLADREPAVQGTLRMTLDRPGTEVDSSSPLVQGVLASCEAHDVPGRVEGMTAWVDAAFLNEAGIPAVCFGPGDIAQAHTADEWVDAGQISTCADVLESFARSLAAP